MIIGMGIQITTFEIDIQTPAFARFPSKRETIETTWERYTPDAPSMLSIF